MKSLEFAFEINWPLVYVLSYLGSTQFCTLLIHANTWLQKLLHVLQQIYWTIVLLYSAHKVFFLIWDEIENTIWDLSIFARI